MGFSFSKAEVCKVYRRADDSSYPHVLIDQPPSEILESFNRVIGVLIYEEDGNIYEDEGIPVIALIPNGDNRALSRFLQDYDDIEVELVDAVELPFWMYMTRDVSDNRQTSLLATALMHNGYIDAIRECSRASLEEEKLIGIWVKEDDCRFTKTREFLKTSGLLRENTLAAVSVVLDQMTGAQQPERGRRLKKHLTTLLQSNPSRPGSKEISSDSLNM